MSIQFYQKYSADYDGYWFSHHLSVKGILKHNKMSIYVITIFNPLGIRYMCPVILTLFNILHVNIHVNIHVKSTLLS